MRLKYFSLFLPFCGIFWLFVISCNKKCRAVESSNGAGIIRSLDFKNCTYYASNVDSHLVIRSSEEWNAYKREELKFCPDTHDIDVPDFNFHSILALDIKTFACNVAYHRSFVLDSTAQKATYTIKLEKCGPCNTKFRDPNFVVVPKIPKHFSVTFLVEHL